MWINNLNPIIFSIGPLQATYYGAAYAISFIVLAIYMQHVARKKEIPNFSEDKTDVLLLYIGIGTIIGARIFYFLIYHMDQLISNPVEIFYIWRGGLTVYGGIIGILTTTYLFCKKYQIDTLLLLDKMVMTSPVPLILIRLGNFINGELVGLPSNVPWCVIFPNIDNACRHPTQIYTAFQGVIILFVLLKISKNKQFKKGTLLWSFTFCFGLLRFILDFLKDDPIIFLGINTGQFMALVLMIISAVLLYRLNRKTKPEHKTSIKNKK